jgi:hypothetical protein
LLCRRTNPTALIARISDKADLKDAMAQAHDFRVRAARLISGEYNDNTRTTLLIGFADQIFEHHQAILQLRRSRWSDP